MACGAGLRDSHARERRQMNPWFFHFEIKSKSNQERWLAVRKQSQLRERGKSSFYIIRLNNKQSEKNEPIHHFLSSLLLLVQILGAEENQSREICLVSLVDALLRNESHGAKTIHTFVSLLPSLFSLLLFHQFHFPLSLQSMLVALNFFRVSLPSPRLYLMAP